MLSRRNLISRAAQSTLLALPAANLFPARKSLAADYAGFVASVRAEALAKGFDRGIVNEALSLAVTPNQAVLKLDRHQPEFTLTWAQYRQKVVSTQRITNGRAAFTAHSNILDTVERHYGVDARIIAGIWGLESGFGKHSGTFHVIDALATLAYDGRRSKFFHDELMKALQILNARDISPANMLGSYAGAMGQPQFMPSAYLRYAVDFTGDGKRNIWTNDSDIFASVGNYLSKSGWIAGEPWGQQVRVPDSLAQSSLGRDNKRSLAQWMQAGVRRADGSAFSSPAVQGAIIRPDGPGGEAFMVYRNFAAIRRYNPSDFYALGVGLLGYALA